VEDNDKFFFLLLIMQGRRGCTKTNSPSTRQMLHKQGKLSPYKADSSSKRQIPPPPQRQPC